MADNYKQKLSNLGIGLLKIEEELERLSKQRELFKQDIFHCFDILFGEGEKAEFVLEDGTVIARIVRVSEVLDEEKLKDSVGENDWLDITIERRTVDSDKLQKAISSGTITIEQVKPAISERKSYALTSKKKKKDKEDDEASEFMKVLHKAIRKE